MKLILNEGKNSFVAARSTSVQASSPSIQASSPSLRLATVTRNGTRIRYLTRGIERPASLPTAVRRGRQRRRQQKA